MSIKRRLAKLEERKATTEPAQIKSAIVIVDSDGEPLTPIPANTSLLITIPDNGRGDATHGKNTDD